MKAFISLLCIRVTEKDTFKSTWIKFVLMEGMNINVTNTPKNFRYRFRVDGIE